MMMFFLFWFVVLAWFGGVVVSVANGNRRFPAVALVIGLLLLILSLKGLVSFWGMAGQALLAAIIWIANKADTI